MAASLALHDQIMRNTISIHGGRAFSTAGEGASIEDVVTRYLWSRDLLLVIDNCEHLLDAAAAAIKLLLDACPDLRVIATSRKSLGIRGEAMLRVPSLGLADATHALEDSEAVHLFLDQARAVRPDYQPTIGRSPRAERDGPSEHGSRATRQRVKWHTAALTSEERGREEGMAPAQPGTSWRSHSS